MAPLKGMRCTLKGCSLHHYMLFVFAPLKGIRDSQSWHATHTHTHTHTHIYIYIYIYTYIYIYIYTYMYIYMYTYRYIYIYIYTYVHVYIHIHVCTEVKKLSLGHGKTQHKTQHKTKIRTPRHGTSEDSVFRESDDNVRHHILGVASVLAHAGRLPHMCWHLLCTCYALGA